MSLNTIREITEITGITVNALRYYDSNKQAVYIRPFIDNIAVIDRVYNEPLQIMFDDDYVYFPKIV